MAGGDTLPCCSPSMSVRCCLNWILSFPHSFSFLMYRAFLRHWAVTNRLPGTLFPISCKQLKCTSVLCHWFTVSYLPLPLKWDRPEPLYIGLLQSPYAEGPYNVYKSLLHHGTCRLSLSKRESRAATGETYWPYVRRSYARAAEPVRRHTASWPAIISLHFLSGLQSSCLSPGCGMISTVQDQQPWHAHNQNLQALVILNDSSCISETVLFALLMEAVWSGLRDGTVSLVWSSRLSPCCLGWS